MSNQPATVVLEFPMHMVLEETIDIGDRLEMMRKTKSGLQTYAILWQYVDIAVLAALMRREYRSEINTFYNSSENFNWQAVAADGEVYVFEHIICRRCWEDINTGNYIGEFEFDNPQLAMIIKLAAKTPKDAWSF
ncbi:hypothetical protein [Neorhizobium sp. T7_12]|uniref:hypothetical protein n=1 Tax=Neorhizobium sp. T7_12 TaxID=2093832 RepID=UPI000CFA69A7|nr:hypothetical protein [Neorhizobium sp. T7_12]